jgi:ech hydrogenase subunit A
MSPLLPYLLLFLVAFPLVVGLLLILVSGAVRDVLVVGASAVIAAASIALAVSFASTGDVFLAAPAGLAPGHAVFGAELAIGLFFVVLGVRHRRFDAAALAALQVGLGAWAELTHRLPEPDPARLLGLDRLSIVLVLIVGIIGSLICVHALGYMRDYHRHYPLVRGRRRVFFFLVFAFLSAMFGLVVSNELTLLHFFWEVTTLSSFLLIGYTRTPETIRYAFNALSMNLLGGVAFSLAIVVLARGPDGLDFARLCAHPAAPAALPAIALLALAGLTKSAQMPFSSWLLGAMYAPTPTSALLHSSTMVKAGVFLLLKLSPAMRDSVVGTTVALVGFLTFLFASLIAATEPNAKRVLAWSTIGNLGLVVGCAGVATPATAWTGVMIVIFHAAAKSLMFLVVGTLENRLYTKDLEGFDNLVARFPRVSLLALVGIAGMFLAPFGIVLAKWSVMRALLAVPGWRGAFFLVVMAYGSACTIYYWTKILVKFLAVRAIAPEERAIERRVSGFELFSESVHAAIVIGLTLGIGALSAEVVTPYALGAFGAPPQALLHVAWYVVVALAFAVLALPALALVLSRSRAYRYHLDEVYASGRAADAAHRVESAAGEPRAVALRNYYLSGVVSAPAVFRTGTALCAVILGLMVLLPMLVLP